jgi:hypothetical protein
MKTLKSVITAIAVLCNSPMLFASSYFKNKTPLLIKLLCSKQVEDFNDEIYSYWLKETPLPEKLSLQKQLNLQFNLLPITEQSEMINSLRSYYTFLTEEISSESTYEKLKTLTALEIGDHSTPEMEALQIKWAKQKLRLQKIQKKFSYLCNEHYNPTDETTGIPMPAFPPTPPPGLDQAVWGLRVAFATTYQSCKVLALPPMDNTTENLSGIAISGTHSDGVGRKRVYKDVAKILATHYYYKNILPLEKSCYLPAKQPLIYDYGGKPATSSAASSTLDLFTNQGSGTSVLGIDCSGFVFTAVARSGLRLAPAKPLKAALVHGISARMFKDPQKNGLGCFSPITLSTKQNIYNGDIAAKDGHVVMIDDVGSDPFGIARIKTISDCNLQHISYENFDFAIVQSSPYKNAIGIGKAKASAYLGESATMRTGFEKYALAACQAQFGKPQTPFGGEVTIVRNKATSDCINENYISLAKESCIANCQF